MADTYKVGEIVALPLNAFSIPLSAFNELYDDTLVLGLIVHTDGMGVHSYKVEPLARMGNVIDPRARGLWADPSKFQKLPTLADYARQD